MSWTPADVGKKCKTSSGKRGTVRWVGEGDFAPGTWVGVELVRKRAYVCRGSTCAGVLCAVCCVLCVPSVCVVANFLIVPHTSAVFVVVVVVVVVVCVVVVFTFGACRYHLRPHRTANMMVR